MFFKIKQILKISFFSLLSNKTRSFLTILGIVIGVSSVILIASIGHGAQSLILNEIKSIGSDLIGVMPGRAEEGSPPTSVMGIVITTLTADDALALADKNNVPDLLDAVAYARGSFAVSYKNKSYQTNINACTANYFNVEGGEIQNGRFFSKNENKEMARVAVLGVKVKKELFGEEPAIGKKIKINKKSFSVIGVLKERGTVALQDYDDQVLIPLKTGQKLILGIDYINFIRAKANDEKNLERAMDDMRKTLRERHKIKDQSGKSDDFTVRSIAQIIDMLGSITDALRYFLIAMSALALFVGGVGIMNIMLVGVKERTREIGLRKAIGANNFDILIQFLFEAIFITFLGALIGIVFGLVFSWLIALWAKNVGYDWDFIIPLSSILSSVFLSILLGLVFGIYPAKKASAMSPMEALRYE